MIFILSKVLLLIDFTLSKLGETAQLIELDQSDDFVDLIISMSKQAKHQILIFSYDLDKVLYGNNKLYEIIKNLAIKNHRNQIKILVQNAVAMTKNDHPLLKLSHRVSRNISIKITSREYRGVIKTFIIFDDCGYIIQDHPERYEASGNFSARAEIKQLVKKFHEMWKRGEIDNSLRQLRL